MLFYKKEIYVFFKKIKTASTFSLGIFTASTTSSKKNEWVSLQRPRLPQEIRRFVDNDPQRLVERSVALSTAWGFHFSRGSQRLACCPCLAVGPRHTGPHSRQERSKGHPGRSSPAQPVPWYSVTQTLGQTGQEAWGERGEGTEARREDRIAK